MVTIEHDELVFSFPEVHKYARCSVHFQRTLRIPDDGRRYDLPAGLGPFPLRHVEDFAAGLPDESVKRGGVIAPIYQSEALWVSFGGDDYPCAVKIATGKVCAVSGEPWEEGLAQDPQNYVVLPDQPWLDGYCVGKGTIRQFVAMPLGEGYTAEEQLTGAAEHGGLQVAVYPIKREIYEEMERRGGEDMDCWQEDMDYCLSEGADMGLAPGGLMRQETYDDEHGLDAWDQEHGGRCFVTLANAVQWMTITGERPPTEPFTAEEYAEHGLPWFAYYDLDRKALDGAKSLAGLKSVGEMAGKRAVVDGEW